MVLANGGQASEVEGTWSATLEWLVGHLAPRFPELAFAEVRYRIKSWKRLDLCEEDLRAAVAKSRRLARCSSVSRWAGRLRHSPRTRRASKRCSASRRGCPTGSTWAASSGERLDVLHGTLDRWLPGIPGVSPDLSRRGFERAEPSVSTAPTS